MFDNRMLFRIERVSLKNTCSRIFIELTRKLLMATSDVFFHIGRALITLSKSCFPATLIFLLSRKIFFQNTFKIFLFFNLHMYEHKFVKEDT